MQRCEAPHRAELRLERNTDLLLCHVISSLSMPPRFMTGAAGAPQ
jgi:hypothetical protein